MIEFLSQDEKAHDLTTNLLKYHFQVKRMLESSTSLDAINLRVNTISFRYFQIDQIT